MEKPKRQKRSKEEIYIANMEKEERKKIRSEKKAEKDRIKEEKRIAKENPTSEEELVHRYVNRVMNNQRNHGRVDSEKTKGLAYENKVNKNLWLDSSFYCSLVFQSQEQKNEFLGKIGVSEEDIAHGKKHGSPFIINGLELAERLDIELEEETSDKYPKPDLALLPYILDNEAL